MKSSWNRLKYIGRTVAKGGLLSFLYLLGYQIKSLRNPQWKYRYWRKKHEKPLEKTVPAKEQPFFSVILTGKGSREVSIHSLQAQDYVNQEIYDEESSSWKEILLETKGDYIGILCRGDRLAENALQKMAGRIRRDSCKDCLLFYSDEDRMTGDGERKEPFFKPDYSPDTLRSFFYIGGFLVLKRELAQMLTANLQMPVLYGGYLLALEASLLVRGEQVCHIPEVLYHRRINASKPDIVQMGNDKKSLLRQYGIEVQTEEAKDCGEVRVIYDCRERPKISIIIPSKDNPELLKVCLDSIVTHSRYENYEIIVVDNGSNAENRSKYEQLCSRQEFCRYYYEPMEFNFSRMCNIGVKKAAGEFCLFLNDDIEVRPIHGPDWMERMLGQAMQEHVGAVGAKLLYPSSNRIQHVGVVNYESGAAHILRKYRDDEPLLFGRNRLDYNYSIVTAACLLIQKEKFRKVNGFSEELKVAFNDVELCFKLLKQGYYNVVRSDVVLFHHESISRGEDTEDVKKFRKHLKERERLFELHPSKVKRDRFYSKNLTQKELDGSINVEYRPDSFETFTDMGKVKIVEAPAGLVDCVIEYAQMEDGQICIRGFAFLKGKKHNNLNKIYVVLRGEQETRYAKTRKLYNHTISVQREAGLNLNFTEFYTRFPMDCLKDHHYQIGVLIQPFAESRAYLHETIGKVEKMNAI